MMIRNKNELATTPLREEVLVLVEAGIKRILPPNLMKNSVTYDSRRRTIRVDQDPCDLTGGRLFVIGGGKASGLMAETLEQMIGSESITAGVVNCKSAAYVTDSIRIREAGHPIPDGRGIDGVNEMLSLKECYRIDEHDVIICLISGGGSALMPCPATGISLSDKQSLTALLIASGAAIGEINAVRKHLSRIKGGRLGEFFAPATVLSLIISDVIGNDLSVIASGPTYPDRTTYSDALDILAKYNLLSKAPQSVLRLLEKGKHGEVAETPKKLANCKNHIIGDNRLALEAMAAKAREMGLNPLIVTAAQKGDTETAARTRADEIQNGKYTGFNVILIGGETTPKLPDVHGKGGRNQHYAASSMLALKDYPGGWALASIGTDGSDYLPDVAGGLVDSSSLEAALSLGIDVRGYLDSYDSFTLLEQMGNSLVITGDTGTNVGDVMVYVLKHGGRTDA
ncbi:MAG: DUF4147 domain-containing protein [Chloroflexota bacterium]